MARSSGNWLLASLGLVALTGGCKDGGTAEGDTGSGGIEITTGGSSESGPVLDVNMADSGNIGCGEGVGECSDQLDLLFIIDNSGSMGEEQQNLASNLPGLVRALEHQAAGVTARGHTIERGMAALRYDFVLAPAR
mgnify:CR=1 FL=1